MEIIKQLVLNGTWLSAFGDPVAITSEIYDEELDKSQSEINALIAEQAEGKSAVSYSLVPSVSLIAKKKNGTVIPDGNVTCSVIKTTGDNPPETITSGFVLTKRVDNGDEVAYSATAASSVNSQLTFYLYIDKADNQRVLVAIKTISVVEDGQKGNDAPVWTIGNDGFWYKDGVNQNIQAEAHDGTGIELKGAVATVIDLGNVTGMAYGDCYIVNENGWLYFYDETTPASQGTTTKPVANPAGWNPIGEIKGEPGIPGTTYYYHIAWATNITFDLDGVPNGCTGFSVVKGSTNYDWMGICIDTNMEDPSGNDAYKSYKWNYVKGPKGDNVTISGTSITYAVTRTGSQPNDNKFTYNQIPSLSLGDYLWSKTTVSYNDGTVTTTYAVSRIGEDGIEGTPGTQGADGRTPYFHIAYANSADGSTDFSKTYFSGALYIGTYTDYTQADSSSHSDYTWARIKGEDGSSVTLDLDNSSIEYAFSQSGVAGTGREYPSDITAWSPSVPDARKGEYLWTKDTTAYNDGGMTKYTITYGVSYYGTDGTDVQIDTDRTFVKYSTQKTASKPNDNTFTLSSPPTLSQGDYLWILSQTAYVGMTDALKSYSVSRVGADGSDGDEGADGYTTHFAYAQMKAGQSIPSDGKLTSAMVSKFQVTNFSGADAIGTYRDQNGTDSTNIADYTWTQWKGNDAVSIDNVTEYYLISSSSSGVTTSTSGWVTSFVSPTAEKKYLWNYERITYSDNTFSDTIPVIIGNYSANGRGIQSITEYYKVSSSSTGVSNTDSGWNVSMPTMDETNKYLWNYELITYTDNTTSKTTAVIIGVYGERGPQGQSYRILWSFANTPSVEVHNVPCNDDWTCDLANNNHLKGTLQQLVNGVWTTCTDYYVSTRAYDIEGRCQDGFNSTTKAGVNQFNATLKVNSGTYRYYEIYFTTVAQTGANTDSIDIEEVFMSSRIYKLPKGSDVYQFDVAPYVMSWVTDEDGYIGGNNISVTGTMSARKGGELMSNPSITATSGIPVGFTLDVNEVGGNTFSVTPHQYYTYYTYNTTRYYIMKKFQQYAVGDLVYDQQMLNVGRVTDTASSGPSITLNGESRPIQLTNGGQGSLVFDEPSIVTLTLESESVSRNVAITLMPAMQGYPGSSGDDAIRLDLDNEMDSIQYSGKLNKIGSDVQTTAKLYQGENPVTSGVTYSITGRVGCSDSGATIDSSTGVVTVSAIGANYNKATVTIQASYNNHTYNAVFVVNKLIDKPKYWLQFDKNVVSVNTTASSDYSETITVYVYKDTIDNNGTVTHTLVTSLSNEGLKLFNDDHGIVEITGYDSGVEQVVIYSNNRSSLTFYLTTSTANTTNYMSYLVDMETIPILKYQDGDPGEPGRMGRNIYYAGTMQELNGAEFYVDDYQAPYVKTGVDSNGNPMCYVFVGENSGTQAYHYPTTLSGYIGSSDWEQMTSDYKYLITNAVFSDFAKLGSGVFNRDYAFSQYGTRNGSFSEDYEYFIPTGSRMSGYVMGSSPSSPIVLGSFTAESSKSYYLSFETDVANNAIMFGLATTPDASQSNWLFTWDRASTAYSVSTPTSLTDGQKYYILACKANGNGNEVAVTIDNSSTFKPNFYINWLTGHMYSKSGTFVDIDVNKGKFVDVTVEGVINNLYINIDETNYSDYGSRSGSGQTFWLDPTKVGNLVRYNCNSPLGLPSAWYVGAPDAYTISSGGVSITLDELRQCIGKKIYLYTADNNGLQSFYCGEQGNGMFVYETGHPTIEDILATGESMTSDVEYVRKYQYVSPQSMQNSFFILECKLGEYDNHECIYWGITRSAFRMDHLTD